MTQLLEVQTVKFEKITIMCATEVYMISENSQTSALDYIIEVLADHCPEIKVLGYGSEDCELTQVNNQDKES